MELIRKKNNSINLTPTKILYILPLSKMFANFKMMVFG
jgi:hypothetical protein